MMMMEIVRLQSWLRLNYILWVALLTVGVQIGMVWIWFAQHPMEKGYWVAGPDDDYAQLVSAVEAIQTSKAPAVVLVGSSALREAIVSPDELRRQRSNKSWHVLTAGDLYPIEMAQVVSELPRDLEGVLLLEVSLRTLSVAPSTSQQLTTKPRLPYQGVQFQQTVLKSGYTPGLGIGWLSFYLSRWNILEPMKIPYERWLFHQVDFIEPSQIDWGEVFAKKERWLEAISMHVETNVHLLKTIVDMAPPQMRVAFIASPRNPKWVDFHPQDPDGWTQYEGALKELQNVVHHPIIKIDEGISAEHFLDHGHIRTLMGRQLATQNILQLEIVQ